MTKLEGTMNSVKITASICLCIFGVVCAMVVGNIYSPNSPPLTAAQMCAKYNDARGSAFCLEIAKSGAR